MVKLWLISGKTLVFLQKSTKLAPFWSWIPSFGMIVCEDSENHGLEAQILHFGRFFSEIAETNSFFAFDAINRHVWRRRFRKSWSHSGRVFPKSVKLAPFGLFVPPIGTSGGGDSENEGLEAQILYFG